ncbi:MAG: hypothetical protein KGY70_20645 [Bacteroidales bacterium]|nr:hypothetical protein [Bacteroidales bacterium]
MNKAVRYLFLVVVAGLFILPRQANAQSGITIDASQQMTSFEFTNSAGNIDNSYSPIYSGAYTAGYTHVLDFGLYFNTAVGMRNAGATMTLDDTHLRWDFRYAQGKLGLGYMYDLGRFRPYLGVSGYYAKLLKANQRINDPTRENINYDLMEAGMVNEKDYGLLVTPGVRIAASDFISVYTEFEYLMGLQNIETGASNQEATNMGYSLTLGLSITIAKKEE